MNYQQRQAIQKRAPSAKQFATVSSVSGGKARLVFDGETSATTKYFRVVGSCSAGNRVRVEKISGVYVVTGVVT